MGHLDGEGGSGGRAGAAKVGSQDVALVRRGDVHVLSSVGSTDDGSG